jgi:hypothetical protein
MERAGHIGHPVVPTPVRYGVGERDFLHGVWFGPQEPTALRDAVAGVHAFNGLIASIYAAAGNPVTEVEDALSTSDDGDADGAATASRTTWSRCAP